MRLVGRILVICAGATLPAVVAVVGCVVDSDRYPGIPNSIPNGPFGGGTPSTSSSSSSSSSSTGGTSLTVCQCAATIVSPDGGACGTCGGNVVKAGAMCSDAQAACNADPACGPVLSCIIGCPAGATYASCVESCIKGNATYGTLAACQCSACAVDCAVPAPLPCNLGTGGAGGGGTGGAGTGGAGTGGAAADAGDGG